MSPRRSRGFTLVEALLALAIFATIAVLAYRATAALTDGETRLAGEAQRWRTLESFFVRFEADIRQAIPRSVRVGNARAAPWLGTVGPGRQGALEFSRAGAEFSVEPGLGGQRVGYRWRDGTVEIAYWPHLDRPGGTAPAVYPLVPEVAQFELAYLARDGAWRDRWPGAMDADLPRAVRMTLLLADGVRVERAFVLR
jgi:general secretion pathway protein J